MDGYVRIYGRVTDFNGSAIANCNVEIKDADMTQTDGNGGYEINVKKGNYTAIAAVKDYAVSQLEYWGWNAPAFDDIEINMRVDAIEVYAVNAFMIQRSRPFNSMMIYFRPMSLSRYKKLTDIDLNSSGVINISPDLNENNISVAIDGQTVNILTVNKVIEQGIDKPIKLYGYLVQTTLPETESDGGYAKIHISLNDDVTGEKGEGSLFWKKPKAFELRA